MSEGIGFLLRDLVVESLVGRNAVYPEIVGVVGPLTYAVKPQGGLFRPFAPGVQQPVFLLVVPGLSAKHRDLYHIQDSGDGAIRAAGLGERDFLVLASADRSDPGARAPFIQQFLASDTAATQLSGVRQTHYPLSGYFGSHLRARNHLQPNRWHHFLR